MGAAIELALLHQPGEQLKVVGADVAEELRLAGEGRKSCASNSVISSA